MSTTYNPMAVMMGNPGKTGTPYLNPRPSPGGSIGPIQSGQFTGGPSKPRNVGGSIGPIVAGQFTGGGGATTPPASQPQGPNIASPESVRATGSGPFDPAFRQNLATFAGGLFNRPGGNLSFNPTSNQSFGQATGGGDAPLLGMPNTLLSNALGGNPFSYTPPAPADTSNQNIPVSMQDWLNRFMNSGIYQRAVQE
jgi:hypothetical protein